MRTVFRLNHNMYAKVVSCVSLTLFGFRQGCQMFPLLFTLYIDDIIQFLGDEGQRCIEIWVFILLFADDMVLTESSVVGLQRRLDKLSVHCNT